MESIEWSKIIGASVIPVVIISACGLLCLAFYNRLAAIVTRLRTFQREQIREIDSLASCKAVPPAQPTVLVRHRKMIEMLDRQSASVMRRAALMRSTLLYMLAAVSSLVLCSLALALGTLWPTGMRHVAAPFFVAGLWLMFAGLVQAMRELVEALEPIQEERRFVRSLRTELLGEDAGDSPDPAP